ncbi:MAG: DUF47 family protein [Acidobacteriota bacterium]
MMKLLPKENIFFQLFEEQGENLLKLGVLLSELKENYVDLKIYSEKFKQLEHETDIVTHRIIERLNKTFITPIDREDIHSLAHELDEIVDFVEEAIFKIRLYKIERIHDEMIEFISTLIKSINEIVQALDLIKNKKNYKNILDICIKINSYENEGDRLMRDMMEKLLNNREEHDSFKFFTHKEIYESFEMALDKCEDIANIIEGIVIKNM